MKFYSLRPFLVLVLLVCMIFSFAVCTGATGLEETNSQPNTSLSLSSTSNGTTVTVVVGLETSNIALSGIDFRLEFDNSNLTLTSTTGSIFSFSFTSYDKANSNGYVNAMGYLGSGDTTATGTLATFTFSARDEFVNETAFKLTRGSGSDASGNSFDLTLPNLGSDDVKSFKIYKGLTVNGTLSVDPSAFAGSIVTIIAKPASGCDVDTVAVTDANNVSIPVFDNKDNYVFTMPDSDVTVNVTFKENPISEPSVNKDSTSNETVADDYNITVEESENGNVTTEVISKEESSADVSVDDNTTVNSESITTDSQNSDFESSADSTIPVTSPSDVDSDANPQEEASNDNILLWVLPAILLILIAALVVLLIVRKKRLEQNY